MYEAHYTKLLSPHFSEEQIENLIPIIRLMQDPYSFEIGILQLRAQNLYDPFIHFLEEYVIKYGGNVSPLNHYKETILLEYMFGRSMECRYESEQREWRCSANLYQHGDWADIYASNIILPLFCQELDFFGIYKNVPPNPKIVNIKDILYPIKKVDCGASELLFWLPVNVRELKIWVSSFEEIEQTHLPSRLEKLCLLSGCKLKPNAIQHLQNLQRLEFEVCDDILALKFPPSILGIFLIGGTWDKDVEVMKYILGQNSKLQLLDGDYFGEDIEELLKQHSFIYNQRGWYERELNNIS